MFRYRQISIRWILVIAVLASSMVASVVMAGGKKGLISQWEGDGDALDSRGSNDGTLEGDTTFVPGIDDNQAFSFDGTGDHVLVSDSPSLNPTKKITLAAWVQATGGQGQHRDIVSKDGEGTKRQYLLTASASNIFRAHVGFSSTTSNSCDFSTDFHLLDGGTPVVLGQWYHVAMTYDGSTLKLYVDGVQDGSCDVSGTMLITDEPVRIAGGASSGAPFHLRGVVDDARIYNSALSAKKVKKIHDKGRDVIKYDFNSLSGSNASPYTSSNGQDNWTSNGFKFGTPIPSWFVGVSQSLGFDGTEAFIFDRVGPGFGADASRLNDNSFSFKKMKKRSYIQADFGVGFWGNQFALGHDADEDGVIRKTDPAEIGPRIRIGCNNPLVGVQLVDAAANITKVSATEVSDGSGCGEWIRLRLVMDLKANNKQGSGSVWYQNLTRGDPGLQPVAGLQNINLALDKHAADASNPKKWDGMWTHMEGATNQLDNIVIDDGHKRRKGGSSDDSSSSSDDSSDDGSS